MRTMIRGDRGDDVNLLQLSLGIKNDSIFGVKTEAAVKEFQENNGLVIDGKAGIRTCKKLGILEAIEEIQARDNIILDCPNIKQQQLPHGPKIYGPNKTYSKYSSSGCCPTSICCVVQSYWDESTTVEDIGELCIHGGYRIKDNGTSPAAINYCMEKFGGHAEATRNVSKILAALKDGNLVVMHIKKGFNNQFKGRGHFIVCYGIKDGKILLRDVGSKADRRQWAYIRSLPEGLKNAYICYKE